MRLSADYFATERVCVPLGVGTQVGGLSMMDSLDSARVFMISAQKLAIS